MRIANYRSGVAGCENKNPAHLTQPASEPGALTSYVDIQLNGK
jgi:hypothetical protein